MTGKEILEAVNQMTPEEKAAFSAALKDLEPKPAPVTEQLGEPLDLRPRDERGRLLTEEEIWDRDHLLDRKPYGFSETIADWQGKVTTKVWTRAEIDAWNKPIEEAWLAEKRKVFPDAQLPPNTNISGRVTYKHSH